MLATEINVKALSDESIVALINECNDELELRSKQPAPQPENTAIVEATVIEEKPAITEICSDAWTSGNPGIGGARVTDLQGSVLMSHDTPANEFHSNNFFELMGIGMAVHYAMNNGIKVIYTDSQTAMAWIRDGKPGKSVKKDVEAIQKRCLQIQQRVAEHNIKIVKWDTEKKGEIPADYGRK